MNYFFKSLWFGALITPKCWAHAFMRNPMMPVFLAAVLFFLTSIFCDAYLKVAIFLFCSWMLGTMLFIITPSKCFKLHYLGKPLYLFLYNTYGKFKFNVQDSQRCAILRVLENDGYQWQKSKENLAIYGYDASLESLGFILVRLPYAEWVVFGNGYNKGCEAMTLGHKITNYAFASRSKVNKIYFIHGRKIVSEAADTYEKYSYITIADADVEYQEIDITQCCTSPASVAYKKNGCFLLIKNKDNFRVFKLLKETNAPGVYQLFTNKFYVHKNDKLCCFQSIQKGIFHQSSEFTNCY